MYPSSPSSIISNLVFLSIPLNYRETSWLRGAVIKLLSVPDVLFHNHTQSGYRYSYPLVQYKSIDGKAALLFVGELEAELQQFLERACGEIKIGQRRVALSVEHVETQQTQLCVSEKSYIYKIERYLPLNTENHALFERTEGLADRCRLLERLIVGNLLSMAKGLGVNFDRKVEVCLRQMSSLRFYIYKGVQMLGFDLEFQANVDLPGYIGLGKGVSLGFGCVTKRV